MVDSPRPRVNPVPRSLGKQVYTTPEIVEYGTVGRLTQSGGATTADVGTRRHGG
jgi:hypothetical protein